MDLTIPMGREGPFQGSDRNGEKARKITRLS